MEAKPNEESNNGVFSAFDDELGKFADGKITSKHIFDLGKPGEILQKCGFPKDHRIELSSSRLMLKAAQGNHPFDITDVKGLDKAIQNPVAVFEYGNKEKSQNVIVELQKDGKNFLVGVFFNQNREGFEVSSIRGLFNRDNIDWIRWIEQRKMIYGDKEKIQVLAAQQRTNLADVNRKEARTSSDSYYLDSVDSIMQKFGDVKDIYTENFEFYKENKERYKIFKAFRDIYQGLESIETADAPMLAKEFYEALKNDDTRTLLKYTDGEMYPEIAERAGELVRSFNLEHNRTQKLTDKTLFPEERNKAVGVGVAPTISALRGEPPATRLRPSPTTENSIEQENKPINEKKDRADEAPGKENKEMEAKPNEESSDILTPKEYLKSLLSKAEIEVIEDTGIMRTILDEGKRVQKMAAKYGTNQDIDGEEASSGFGTYVVSVNEENARQLGIKIASKKYGGNFYINEQPFNEFLKEKNFSPYWISRLEQFNDHSVEFLADDFLRADVKGNPALEKERGTLSTLFSLDLVEYKRERTFLYSVDIPDNDGTNYLLYGNPIGIESANRINERLERMNVEWRVTRNDIGKNVYFNTLSEKVFGGSQESASKFLKETGYAGMEMNSANYIVFDDKDMKVTNRMQYMIDGESNVYGFAYDGKIYADPEIATSNTYAHEYTHLWDAYTQRTNPELWEKGKDIFKGTSLWNEVMTDENYRTLSNDDEILSECHSRIVGRMAEKVLERIAERNGGILRDQVIDWDSEVAEYIAGELGAEFPQPELESENYISDSVRLEIAREFLSQPMKDLMEGRKITLNVSFQNNVSKMAEEHAFSDVRDYFQFNKTDNENFKKALDNFDGVNPLQLIKVGEIPPVMKALGISDNPIEMPQSVVSKALREEATYPNDKKGHALTMEHVKRIPESLADPIMVFKSRTRDDSYVFFTEQKDESNRSIIIPVAVDKRYGRLVINEITSIYGKDNEAHFVKTNIEQGNLVYADKKRSLDWERECQVQFLAQVLPSEGSYSSILTKENLVNFVSAVGNEKIQKMAKFVENEKNPAASISTQLSGVTSAQDPLDAQDTATAISTHIHYKNNIVEIKNQEWRQQEKEENVAPDKDNRTMENEMADELDTEERQKMDSYYKRFVKEASDKTDEGQLQKAFALSLEKNIVPLTEVKLNRENWNMLFPNGFVETPVGTVKLGENQFEKLQKSDRHDLLGAMYETLSNPAIVLEKETFDKNSGDFKPVNVYGKSFVREDSNHKRAVESVVIFKDGEEISISTHNKDINGFVKQIKTADQIIYADSEISRVASLILQNGGSHVRLQDAMSNRAINLKYNKNNVLSINDIEFSQEEVVDKENAAKNRSGDAGEFSLNEQQKPAEENIATARKTVKASEIFKDFEESMIFSGISQKDFDSAMLNYLHQRSGREEAETEPFDTQVMFEFLVAQKIYDERARGFALDKIGQYEGMTVEFDADNIDLGYLRLSDREGAEEIKKELEELKAAHPILVKNLGRQNETEEAVKVENPFLSANPEQVQELYKQAEAVEKMQEEAASNVEFDKNGNPYYPKNESAEENSHSILEEDSREYWKDKFVNDNSETFKMVDDFLNEGIKPKNDEFIFPNVPEILKFADVSENEIVIKTSVINKAMNEHSLSTKEIREAIENIASPVLIFESDKNSTENKKDSYLSLTDTFAENGKPIAFAMNLDSEYERKNRIIEVNEIRTIHDRTLVAKNGTDLIQKWTADGLCRYVDDKKISDWGKAAGVQFPLAVLQSDTNSIPTKSEFDKQFDDKKASDWQLAAGVQSPLAVLQSDDNNILRKSDIVNNQDDFQEYSDEMDKGIEKNAKFFESIKKYLENGISPIYNEFKISETPQILQYAGVPNYEIVITTKILNKAKNAAHNLDNEEILSALKGLSNPIIIFDSDKEKSEAKGNSVLIFTEGTDKNNKPLAIGFEMETQKQGLKENYVVNQIHSIHPRTTLINSKGENMLEKWTEKGLIKYLDDKKISGWLKDRQVQFPLSLANPDEITITNSEDTVKHFPVKTRTGFESQANLQEKSTDVEQQNEKIATVEYIHSSEFIEKFGDWEKANRLEKLKESQSLGIDNKIYIHGIDETERINELRNNPNDENLRELSNLVTDMGKEMLKNLRAEQNLNNFAEPILMIKDDEKKYKFNFSGIKETGHHNLYQKGHIEGIFNIPSIVNNAIYIGEEKNEDNRKPELEKFYYYALGIKLENEDYTAKVVFTENKNGEVYYDQSLSTIEKGKFVDIIKNEPVAVNPINRRDSNEHSDEYPSTYYDKRLYQICQVPQMPYLEKNKDGQWQPTEEAIEAVRNGNLKVKKEGQSYEMIDSSDEKPVQPVTEQQTINPDDKKQDTAQTVDKDILPAFALVTKDGLKMFEGYKVQAFDNETRKYIVGNERGDSIKIDETTLESIRNPQNTITAEKEKNSEAVQTQSAIVAGKTRVPEFAMITQNGLKEFKDMVVQKYSPSEKMWTLSNAEGEKVSISENTFKELTSESQRSRAKEFDENTPAYKKMLETQYNDYFKQRENTASNFIHNLSVYSRKEANSPIDAIRLSSVIIKQMSPEEKQKTKELLKTLCKDGETINGLIANTYLEAVKDKPLNEEYILSGRYKDTIARPMYDTVSAKGEKVDNKFDLQIGDTISNVSFKTKKTFGAGSEKMVADWTVLSASKEGNIITLKSGNSFRDVPRDTFLKQYSKQEKNEQKQQIKEQKRNPLNMDIER